MGVEKLSDAELLGFLRDFDYGLLPGLAFDELEEAVCELTDQIGEGANRELAARVIPEMVRALRSTAPSKQEDINVQGSALHAIAWTPELRGDDVKTILWSAVTHDDPIEVAPIAAGILDDIDAVDGDRAWRMYTSRPDAPPRVKGSSKPS